MACGVSYFFPGNGFCFAIGYLLLFLPVADADNTPPYSYAGEKRRQLHAHGCGADDVGTPSWCLTIIRSLREKPPDALYSHARNIPYLANLNNELIDQTALEALDGVSCSAGCRVWQVASFPADSPLL